ncbi:MAG: hypothetical protein EOO47_24265 [Flavobacterium sp.]|nr:MAG: hypothetical protein EOO47_24265 [Flavobacterium sp.]
MLQKLSYLNIMLAIIYVLLYFKTININSVGIFLIIIINWLALRASQQENYKLSIWHYAVGLWSIYYACYTAYGIFNIVSSSLEYGFVSNDINIYLIFASAFNICILTQLVLYALEAKLKKEIHY